MMCVYQASLMNLGVNFVEWLTFTWKDKGNLTGEEEEEEKIFLRQRIQWNGREDISFVKKKRKKENKEETLA